MDDGVLQTAWCRAGSSFTVEFLGMGLVYSSVASYFGSPLVLALSEQMLKVFLFSYVPQSVVLFRKQMMNWFTEHGHLV